MKQIHINKTRQAKIISSSAFISIIPHFLCCGIPIILSILNSIGISIPLPIFIERLEEKNIAIYIFVFSGFLLFLSFFIYFKIKNNSCHKKCCYNKNLEKINKIALGIALGLYIINLFHHIF